VSKLSEATIAVWVNKYIHAWGTGAKEDIEVLFTEDAEYHEWPYETDWVGRATIVKGWQSRQQWQEGGWDFDWSILTVTGDTAAIKGTGVYKELGTFENLWVIRLTDDGKCSMFQMWNNEAGK